MRHVPLLAISFCLLSLRSQGDSPVSSFFFGLGLVSLVEPPLSQPNGPANAFDTQVPHAEAARPQTLNHPLPKPIWRSSERHTLGRSSSSAVGSSVHRCGTDAQGSSSACAGTRGKQIQDHVSAAPRWKLPQDLDHGHGHGDGDGRGGRVCYRSRAWCKVKHTSGTLGQHDLLPQALRPRPRDACCWCCCC
jgi:hypothetical protein